MTLERATGIILRTRPLTETSLIVEWLTPDLGRLSAVAKGARRPKSSFRGQIDLFYQAEFSFVRSSHSELHTLREVKLLNPHALIRQNLDQLEQAAYCTKLIEKTTESETPIPDVYQALSTFLDELPKHPALPQGVFGFQMKLLETFGLAPNLEETSLSPGSRLLLEKFITLDWPSIFRITLSEAQKTEIGHFLHGFMIYHLEHVPKPPRI